MSPVRVLIVDDHQIVRRSICALLSQDKSLEVICQTADGEEAVKKAAELQPDLVLMDIGLPGMTGIDAGREIRRVSPQSQIIFLSQHDTVQVVQEALKWGGHGYVVKSSAASELLEAIRIVRDGQRYVSRAVSNYTGISEA